MMDRLSLIERLPQEKTEGTEHRLREFLCREDTRLISTRDASSTVAELRRVWRTRLQNTDITGKHLEGAEALLEKLNTLAPQRKVEQYAFSGPKLLGDVFLDRSTHVYLGSIIFEPDSRKGVPASQ